jgi:hypothetical protein
MSEIGPPYDFISGANGPVVTYLNRIVPDCLWPSWIGGEHLPDILLKDENPPPALSGSDELHDYCCPETYVISGGGIEDGDKHDPQTRLDNE